MCWNPLLRIFGALGISHGAISSWYSSSRTWHDYMLSMHQIYSAEAAKSKKYAFHNISGQHIIKKGFIRTLSALQKRRVIWAQPQGSKFLISFKYGLAITFEWCSHVHFWCIWELSRARIQLTHDGVGVLCIHAPNYDKGPGSDL